jgi:hypothetical protein
MQVSANAGAAKQATAKAAHIRASMLSLVVVGLNLLFHDGNVSSRRVTACNRNARLHCRRFLLLPVPTAIFAAAFRRVVAYLDMQQRMELSWLVI